MLLFPSTIKKTPPPYYIPIIVCLRIVLTTWHNDSKVQNRNCAAASSETFPPQALSEHIVSTHWWEWTYWASQQIRSANIAFRSKMSCRTPPPPPPTPPRTQFARLYTLLSTTHPRARWGLPGLSPCPVHPPSASFPSRIRTGLLSHTSPSPHYLTCNIYVTVACRGWGLGGGGGLKWFVLFAAVSLFRDNTWLCKCDVAATPCPFNPSHFRIGFPFSSSLKPSTVPLPDSITLGSHNIPFSDSARNLGFILDSKLSMKKHVIKNLPNCLFQAQTH